MGWELETVEKPFVAQLVGMGWRHIQGDIDDPAVTGRARFAQVVQERARFAQVVQESVLRAKLAELNTRDGRPWLDDERISQAVSAITRISAAKLMEANRIATDLLRKGITVDGRPDWDGGRGQTIQYLDWAHPDRNQFTVINQYRVDCPPGYNSGKAFIIPDLVLLVNGIPLVVVECKSPWWWSAKARRCKSRSRQQWINCAVTATSAGPISRSRTTKATNRCSMPTSC